MLLDLHKQNGFVGAPAKNLAMHFTLVRETIIIVAVVVVGCQEIYSSLKNNKTATATSRFQSWSALDSCVFISAVKRYNNNKNSSSYNGNGK